MAKIRTAQDMTGTDIIDFVSSVVTRRTASGHAVTAPDGLNIADAPQAFAVVDHGRWIVRCPFACGGAEAADPETRLFYCLTCYNADVSRKWLRVIWPEERQLIEASLEKRPQAETRNWHRAETVTDLERENEEHLKL